MHFPYLFLEREQWIKHEIWNITIITKMYKEQMRKMLFFVSFAPFPDLHTTALRTNWPSDEQVAWAWPFFSSCVLLSFVLGHYCFERGYWDGAPLRRPRNKRRFYDLVSSPGELKNNREFCLFSVVFRSVWCRSRAIFTHLRRLTYGSRNTLLFKYCWTCRCSSDQKWSYLIQIF